MSRVPSKDGIGTFTRTHTPTHRFHTQTTLGGHRTGARPGCGGQLGLRNGPGVLEDIFSTVGYGERLDQFVIHFHLN